MGHCLLDYSPLEKELEATYCHSTSPTTSIFSVYDTYSPLHTCIDRSNITPIETTEGGLFLVGLSSFFSVSGYLAVDKL